MKPIGTLQSPFKEKFVVPRQGSLVPEVRAQLALDPKVAPPGSLEGLEAGSPIWLIFHFHKSPAFSTQGKVRPPRLEGQKLGVFATRSPHRPNPIGLTLCHIVDIDFAKRVLTLRGTDLIDGTPILDIKPYLPYADSTDRFSSESSHWSKPEKAFEVIISPEARAQIEKKSIPQSVEQSLQNCLEYDFRPRTQKHRKSKYAVQFDRWDFHFTVQGPQVTVESIVDLESKI